MKVRRKTISGASAIKSFTVTVSLRHANLANEVARDNKVKAEHTANNVWVFKKKEDAENATRRRQNINMKHQGDLFDQNPD